MWIMKNGLRKYAKAAGGVNLSTMKFARGMGFKTRADFQAWLDHEDKPTPTGATAGDSGDEE